MIWNKKFDYPATMRSLVNGKRHYDIKQEKLPSVTTILSATQSEEKRKSLANWKARMGAQYADRIRDVSAMRGTAMHTYLEGHIKGERHLDLTSLGKEAGKMANVVIESGLGDLGEVWGTEVTLCTASSVCNGSQPCVWYQYSVWCYLNVLQGLLFSEV